MKPLPLLALSAALAAGCAQLGLDMGPSATAKLEPTKGSSVRGTVTFTQAGSVVHVKAEVTGLAPNSEHGFHIHDKGDCSSGDGMSAAGHFNPTGKPHGPQSGEHHAGDMPSLVADSYGNASASFDLHGVSVGGSDPDIVGRGLIVHKDPDDFRTQPTGNSGARLACGVIAKS
ncbi:MAG TPA: superoxide dismutase family protein [Usitatibacter sp.]|nr:superoxide dismutase family protein [Usitatibacter sp.]